MSRLGSVLAAVALLSTSCGAGGAAPPVSARGPSEQLLTAADVDRYPPGTPAHALMLWWRNAQFANQTAFLNGFEGSLRSRLETSPNTIDVLNQFASAIRTVRPTIVGVTRGDSVATVYTMIVYRQPLGAKRFIVQTSPRGFAMIRQDGVWRLRDDGFVQSSLPPELRRSDSAS